MLIPVHDTRHSQLDLRPVFQKTTCNRFREANLPQNSGLPRFVTGARARQAWVEGALLSVSIFISFLVGDTRACMPAVLCVGSYAGKTNSWLVMLAETLRAGKASCTKKRSVPI